MKLFAPLFPAAQASVQLKCNWCNWPCAPAAQRTHTHAPITSRVLDTVHPNHARQHDAAPRPRHVIFERSCPMVARARFEILTGGAARSSSTGCHCHHPQPVRWCNYHLSHRSSRRTQRWCGSSVSSPPITGLNSKAARRPSSSVPRAAVPQPAKKDIFVGPSSQSSSGSFGTHQGAQYCRDHRYQSDHLVPHG